MKHLSLILLVFGVVVSMPGCAKIRQMTRRDYALLPDPFVEESGGSDLRSDAAKALAADARESTTDKGFVKLGNGTTSTRSSIITASSSQSEAAGQTTAGANGTGVARLGSPQNGNRTAANGQPLVARPGARPANPSDATQMDMAEMSRFMKQQAEDSGLQKTADSLEKDFAAFAAARQVEWKQKLAAMKQQAAAETAGANAAIQQIAASVSEPGPASQEPEMPSLPAMAFDGAEALTESAQPFIRNAAASVTETLGEAMPAPDSDSLSNPFETAPSAEISSGSDAIEPPNPFAEFEQRTARSERAGIDQVKQQAVEVLTGPAEAARTVKNGFSAFADAELARRRATLSETRRTQIQSTAAAATATEPSSASASVRPARGSFRHPVMKELSTPEIGADPFAGFEGLTPETSIRQSSAKPDSATNDPPRDPFSMETGWRPMNPDRR